MYLKFSTLIYSICCYCETIYGIKDGRGVSGYSHGICSQCLPYNKLYNEACILRINNKKNKSAKFIKLIWNEAIRTRGKLTVKPVY